MNGAYKNILLPAGILIGTVIGAGMFSLPFIFKAVGLTTGLFYLFFFSLIYFGLYLFFADLFLRTGGSHRLVGLAKIYFGRFGFWLTVLSSLLQQFFILTIYLILAPSFSRFFIGGDYLNHLLVFWIVGSFLILFNVRRIASLEFFINIGILLIISLVFLWGLKNFPAGVLNYWGRLDFSGFTAVGPILFALSGALAIPEMIDYFRGARIPISYFKKSVLVGAMVPAMAYVLFVFGVFGATDVISEDAVSGLAGSLPETLLVLIGVLGIFSLLSSYVIVGLNSRKTLQLDIGFSGMAAKMLMVAAPLFFYVVGIKNFINSVSFVGSLFLPLDSILIIFMWMKMNKIVTIPPIVIGKAARASAPLILLVFFTAFFYFVFRQ